MESIFEIRSYVGASPLLFGMAEHKIEGIVGPPLRKTINNRGEGSAQYKSFSLRYSPTEKTLVEIGFSKSAKVTYDALDLFGDAEAFRELLRRDSCPYEYYGFIILLDLGITFTGFHDSDISQRAVTAFNRGRWNHLKEKFKKFPKA